MQQQWPKAASAPTYHVQKHVSLRGEESGRVASGSDCPERIVVQHSSCGTISLVFLSEVGINLGTIQFTDNQKGLNSSALTRLKHAGTQRLILSSEGLEINYLQQ